MCTVYTGLVAGSHCRRRVLDARAESFYEVDAATKSVSTGYFETLSYSKWRELVVVLCHCRRRRWSIISTFIVGTWPKETVVSLAAGQRVHIMQNDAHSKLLLFKESI